MAAEQFIRIVVPGSIIETTDQFLSLSTREQVEVVVYWSGRREANGLYVRKAWFPRQTCSPYSFTVDAEALFELNIGLYRLGHELIGQVHTHPSEAFHSEADDENAVSLRSGTISIVVPEFGLFSVSDIGHAHYYERRQDVWVKLSPSALADRVEFLSE